MEYGEEPHSAADKGIALKAAWNNQHGWTKSAGRNEP